MALTVPWYFVVPLDLSLIIWLVVLTDAYLDLQDQLNELREMLAELVYRS